MNIKILKTPETKKMLMFKSFKLLLLYQVKRMKNAKTQNEFLALNMYSMFFQNKSDSKIYI